MWEGKVLRKKILQLVLRDEFVMDFSRVLKIHRTERLGSLFIVYSFYIVSIFVKFFLFFSLPKSLSQVIDF